MRTRNVLLTLAITVLLATFSSVLAVAQPPEDNEGSLPSGYYVTSDYHGVDTPLGTPIHVIAKTTDPGVTKVTFIWRDGSNAIQFGPEVVTTRTTDGTFGGLTVYVFAAPIHAPDTIGDWGVQAIFEGPTGTARANLEDVIAIRATSFNVIPEIPLLGTVGASAAMATALAFKLKRRQK